MQKFNGYGLDFEDPFEPSVDEDPHKLETNGSFEETDVRLKTSEVSVRHNNPPYRIRPRNSPVNNVHLNNSEFKSLPRVSVRSNVHSSNQVYVCPTTNGLPRILKRNFSAFNFVDSIFLAVPCQRSLQFVRRELEGSARTRR
jgi:hypothetical protein